MKKFIAAISFPGHPVLTIVLYVTAATIGWFSGDIINHFYLRDRK